MNNKGSTLVLLVIIISIVMVLGASLLNIVFANYDIKRFNTETKRAFYLSENGLYESYVIARNLIDEAIDDSVEKVDDYLYEYPLNEEEAKNIFNISYKQLISANINNRININTNPTVEIRNDGNLIFIDNKLNLFLRSTYVSDSDIARITWVELIIGVPKLDDVVDGVYDLKNYIEFGNWNS